MRTALIVDDSTSTRIEGLITDPNAGIGILEKAQVPPVTLGFKISDDDMRATPFLPRLGALASAGLLLGLGVACVHRRARGAGP